ncbi:MAG: hypothetical protein GXO04_00720 [Aquificae bacterium]|nr:hypothetical protein [Aquificota bacterium]
MKRKLTLYAAKTGIEVYPTEVARKKAREGAVGIRAFSMEKREEVKMRMPPYEAYGLALAIERLARKEEGKETFSYHRFTTEEGEFYSKLSLERFTRNSKGFIALVLERGKEKSKDEKRRINVPLSLQQALFLAYFLKNLAYEQSYEEPLEEPEEVLEPLE